MNNNMAEGLLSSCKQMSKVVIVNEQEAILPEVSVAVQVTVVIPSGKALPDGGVHTTLTTPQLSVTLGAG